MTEKKISKVKKEILDTTESIKWRGTRFKEFVSINYYFFCDAMALLRFSDRAYTGCGERQG